MTEDQATQIIQKTELDIITKHFTKNGTVRFKMASDTYISQRLELLRKKLLT